LDLARTQPPTVRPGVVLRSRLLDDLRHAEGIRVVTVTAPAGYGKTTVLAQWAALHEPDAAWLTLDGVDNDPVILLAHLLSAIGELDPQQARSGDETIIPGPAERRLLFRAVEAIRRQAHAMLVVLDDAHVLEEPTAIDAVVGLVDRLPSGSRIAIGARTRLALPYGRWRAAGELLDLDADDLALDHAESEALLRTLHLDPSSDEVGMIRERTGGWPAATYLAGLAVREHHATKMETVTSGSAAYLSDYLESQVLPSMSSEERSLLTRTSILDRLDGSLCDAVLERSGTGAHLESLARRTLFLAPIDRGHNWFKCHDLLREYLRRQLGSEQPESLPGLHRRASAWFRERGEIEEAVAHAFTGGLVDEAAELVAGHVKQLHDKGANATLNRWFAQFDADTIRRHPPVASMAAWLAALDGRPDDYERWSAAAEAAGDVVGPPGDGSASMESSRAMVRALGCRHGPEVMLQDSQVAIDAEPAWSLWRPVALVLRGYARSMTGDVDQARVDFAEVVETATTTSPDARRVALAEIALMHVEAGDRRAAEPLVRDFWHSIGRSGAYDYLTSLLGMIASARLSIRRGELQRAKDELARAQLLRRLVSWAIPWLGVRCLTELARTQLRVGDASGAAASLAQARAILAHRPQLGTLVLAVEELGRAADHRAEAEGDRSASLTDRELRLLPFLQTYLTLGEIGDRLGVSPNTVKTQASSIYSKLGATTRSEAVESAVARGLLPPLDILAARPSST
jgi:LuxR family maltose regulon positive regulatory protein